MHVGWHCIMGPNRGRCQDPRVAQTCVINDQCALIGARGSVHGGRGTGSLITWWNLSVGVTGGP